ncbi:MAG: hypothetical protein ABSG25_16260 [Bryobacteraceae bacterium]
MISKVKPSAEPKWKLGLLAALGVILVGYLVYNLMSSGDAAPQPHTAQSKAAVSAPAEDAAFQLPKIETRPRAPVRPGSAQQLRLEYKDKKADSTTADPTLRLDLLAKVQAVKPAGAERNLFQFAAAPPPKAPEPKIVVRGPDGKPVKVAAAIQTPQAPPPPPPPPPIPLKFYGYTMQNRGPKRAFFIDGDDIIVAVEGQLIRDRYKVVRIEKDSCTVEDVQFKHEEPLRLEEPNG